MDKTPITSIATANYFNKKARRTSGIRPFKLEKVAAPGVTHNHFFGENLRRVLHAIRKYD